MCQGRGPRPTLVLTLVEHLPTDSAFAASTAAEKTGSEISDWRRWQSSVNLSLLIAELIDFTREQTSAHVGKKYKFDPHERPGQKKAARVLTVAQINKMAGRSDEDDPA